MDAGVAVAVFGPRLYTKLILLRKTERRPAAREAYVTASHLNEDHFAPNSWKELQAAYKGIEFIPPTEAKAGVEYVVEGPRCKIRTASAAYEIPKHFCKLFVIVRRLR